MASLSPKDRVSLCLFTYEDGRRCRTPRISSHPHFCFYHAQKESQSQTAEKLAKDLTYFFSGDYLSACDLNTALGRLIPAVIRGQIKPRVARTVAYMFQTLMQSTRLAQHEYINAFGTDGWRDAIHTSVTSNHDHLYPPDPNAPEPEDVSEDDPELEPDAVDLGTELQSPSQPTTASPQPSSTTRPSAADTEAALRAARSIFPDHANATLPQSPAPTPPACHPERSEGPCLDPSPSTIDETQLRTAAAPPPTQTSPPNNAPPNTPLPAQPRRRPGEPIREDYTVHFDHTHRLTIDGKPW